MYMKCTMLIFALTLTAVLAIANQEKRPIGRPQLAQDDSHPPESPARPSQDNKNEQVVDKPQPGGRTDTDEKPLLLDDDGGSDPSAEGRKVADNSRCHVCHLNYADEAIAVVHAKADIGCMVCHGTCDEHIADESWASGGNGTPPSKMYRHQDIDNCCQKCHQSHNAPAQKVIARWQQRCPKEPQKIDPKTIVCTDCHGEHRLKERKCKWK
jgi:hypothetical protein